MYAVVLYQPPDKIVQDILRKASCANSSPLPSVVPSGKMDYEQDDDEAERLPHEWESRDRSNTGAHVHCDAKDVALWRIWPSQLPDEMSDQTEDLNQDCNKDVYEMGSNMMLLEDMGIRSCNVDNPRPMMAV